MWRSILLQYRWCDLCYPVLDMFQLVHHHFMNSSGFPMINRHDQPEGETLELPFICGMQPFLFSCYRKMEKLYGIYLCRHLTSNSELRDYTSHILNTLWLLITHSRMYTRIHTLSSFQYSNQEWY